MWGGIYYKRKLKIMENVNFEIHNYFRLNFYFKLTFII